MDMIVTGDIYKILYEKVREFGIKAVYDSWNPITSELKEEAIVIVTSTPIEPDTYWEKAFVHVNICVPDYLERVNKIKLTEMEKLANQWIFYGIVDEYDNNWYQISKISLGTERDEALKCSYVNLKLLFEILNVK
ncbi:hypothetical protein [Paraprevotella clara]|jgi:hypothetical protein|uniref:hypothetical protein n=1 Tax=Paraprevotella clara TaxID=454154 RepID=UPI002059185D|nr:hypothetical protein [Paraprevotella clara]DAJ72441.1 MAG TPA: hypothetical protein [Caudoviricetes sp.]